MKKRKWTRSLRRLARTLAAMARRERACRKHAWDYDPVRRVLWYDGIPLLTTCD